jgi:predicted ATPase
VTAPLEPSAAPPARITRLDIEGFRVIDKLSLELRPMNVLIGENGSGKSTVLEALEILRKAATMTGEQFFNDLYGLHGGPRMFRGAGNGIRKLRLGITVKDSEGGNDIRYELLLQTDSGGGIRVAEERLHLNDLNAGAEPVDVFFRSFIAGFISYSGKKEELELSSSELMLTSMRGFDKKNPSLPKVREFLGGIRVYPANESNPSWARRPNEPISALRTSTIVRPALTVERGGTNLPNVFFALRNRGPASWEGTLLTLRLGLGDEVEDLILEPSPSGGEVSLSLVFRGVGKIPAFALSDGQLAYLMFVAVTELEQSGLVAFDEPDLHLHPALIYRVADLAEEMSRQRTVVMTTHSDRLLDALSDPADSVILFERAQGFRTAALRPNKEQLAHWLSRYSGLGSARAEGYGSVIVTESAERPALAAE